MEKEGITESLDTLTLPELLELGTGEFGKTAIIGVGLIGGSIGLRMKAMYRSGQIVGHDLTEVLDEALERGAIDRGVGDLSEAVADADLIVVATPVDETIRLLPTILKTAKATAIVTDTSSTKQHLTALAKKVEGGGARYIGGHPLGGSDRQGVANADAGLFDNAYWLFTPDADTPPDKRESLFWWARTLGAYPLAIAPDVHDRVMAMTSHIPFVIAVALSHWIANFGEEEPLASKLATGNFQSMTSLASLPLEAWEGAFRTNQKEIESRLEEFVAVLEGCAKALREGRLSDVWQHAFGLQRRLSRERPGEWDANCELIITVADQPGTLALIAAMLADHDIGIRDIHIVYIRERRGGTLKVVVESRAQARRAMELLTAAGYVVRLKE